MLPIGPLMIEHRLIERMFRVVRRAIEKAEEERQVDPAFVDTAIDFVRSYADECHHGKEEGILFRDLLKKPLSDEHKATMEELVREHVWGRKTTAALGEANERYRGGEEEALATIIECLNALIEFYPKHIEKEDKRFFLPVMNYFSKEEKDRMLDEGYAFDQALFHKKYQDILDRAENRFRGRH